MPKALPCRLVFECVVYVLCVAATVTAHPQAATEGAWTWIRGTDIIPNGGNGAITGIYGTLGTPAPANNPSGRSLSATWIDSSGDFWLFGGISISGLTTYELNDLWEFASTTNQWTWQGGSNTLPCIASQATATSCGDAGVYGTRGVPAPGNNPGGRSSPTSWVDRQGNFWLFGGLGYDSAGKLGALDDLWEFDPTTKMWTWMGGGATLPANTCTAVFGVQGVSAATNYPGALIFNDAWTDLVGNVWLFAGRGCDADGKVGWSNVLWKFDASSHQWTWVSGNSTFGSVLSPPAIYGTQGIPAPGNIPGGRIAAANWIDKQGRLWLFGGEGYDSSGDSGFLNDVWVYDLGTGEWTWIAGDQQMVCPANSNQNCGNVGIYGVMGAPSPSNLPGSRSQSVFWTDHDGNFWLYSGWGFNADSIPNSGSQDLWRFNPDSQAWTWMGGSEYGDPLAVYGTQGLTSAENSPGPMNDGFGWIDANNNLWLFDGSGVDATGAGGFLNDLWVYNPNWTPPPPADFSVAVTPVSLTIMAGQSGTASLTVTPSSGFSSTVNFGCSGLPAGVTCSFSPSTITPSAFAASTTVTLQASTSAALPPPSPLGSNPFLPAVALAASIVGLGFRRLRHCSFLFPLAICMAGTILLSACDSSNYHGSSAQPVTATITLTATSGTLQHSTKLSLTVN